MLCAGLNGTPTSRVDILIVHEKNKFAVLGVEARDRQGVKTKEYLHITSFRTSRRTG